MPKATALWLKNNTTLILEQIADFTGLNLFEINYLSTKNMRSFNPIGINTTMESIKKCEANNQLSLESILDISKVQHSNTRKSKSTQAHKYYRPYIVKWYQINSNNKPIRICALAKMLGIRAKTVKKYLEDNSITDIRNPLLNNLYDQKTVESIFGKCECEHCS